MYIYIYIKLTYIYKSSSQKKQRFWRISYGEDKFVIKYGVVDGVITECEKKVAKDVEKKATKLWKDKQEKDLYTTDGQEKTAYRPMLAHEFDATKLRFPCYAQPKLDGLRCLCYVENGAPKMISRKGLPFTGCKHILADIFSCLCDRPNIVLDGELYSQDIPFAELSGLLKKKYLNDEDSKKITDHIYFYCFDVIVTDQLNESFCDRYINSNIFPLQVSSILPVSTRIVQECEIYSCLDEFISSGFEGIILRNASSVYRLGNRSIDLQKLKRMKEDEFIITGFSCGEGRETGAVIWECATHDDLHRFFVRPRGSIEERKEAYKTASSMIGQPLTVIFQELSPLGIPRFPVGKAIRYDI